MTIAKQIYRTISSMKTGLALLVLIGLVSAVGSAVFPDGFFNTIVFKLLLLLLLLNMVLCTINRLFWFKTAFYNRQNRRGISRQIGILLLHAGIVFILIGGTANAFYGQNAQISIVAGEVIDLSKVINLDQPFSLRLNAFKIALNTDGSPAQYYSNVTILEEGQTQAKQIISVNHPLRYQQIKAYQESYGYLVKAKPVTASGDEPEQLLKEGEWLKLPGTPRVVKIYRYFADFDPAMGMNQSSTKQGDQRIVYSVYENDKLLGVGAAKFGSKIEIDDNKYVVFSGIEPYSVLKIKSDPGLSLAFAGALMFMLGVSMALFLAPVKQNP